MKIPSTVCLDLKCCIGTPSLFHPGPRVWTTLHPVGRVAGRAPNSLSLSLSLSLPCAELMYTPGIAHSQPPSSHCHSSGEKVCSFSLGSGLCLPEPQSNPDSPVFPHLQHGFPMSPRNSHSCLVLTRLFSLVDSLSLWFSSWVLLSKQVSQCDGACLEPTLFLSNGNEEVWSR